MDLPTPNQSSDIEVHTLFLTLNITTIYLLNGVLERPPLFRKESTSELTAKPKGVTEFSQQTWVYHNP